MTTGHGPDCVVAGGTVDAGAGASVGAGATVGDAGSPTGSAGNVVANVVAGAGMVFRAPVVGTAVAAIRVVVVSSVSLVSTTLVAAAGADSDAGSVVEVSAAPLEHAETSRVPATAATFNILDRSASRCMNTHRSHHLAGSRYHRAQVPARMAIPCRVMPPAVRVCSDIPMHVLRTPDERFVDLADFPFDPPDLVNVTMFGQDWGSLIGLRLVAAEPDRFARVANPVQAG